MILTVLVPVAILGILVVTAVLFIQRGAGGLDASPRVLLRLYLYLGSLVSILVLVFGLSQLLGGALGAVAPEFTYGVPPQAIPAIEAARPGEPPRPEARAPLRSAEEQNARRTREGLLQGITSAVVGAIFWGVHWYGRRQLETAEERASLLRRAYFLLGVVIFGVASIVLLPIALYSALRWFLIPVGEFDFRQGVGESLAAALVIVPVWLVYLRIVLRDLRTATT